MSDPSIWREHGAPLLAPTGSGPLDGLSVAVKDLFAVGGFAVGAGSPRWLAQAAVETGDAAVVGRLRAAGASIAGIARTDELAFSLSGTSPHYGTPPNPAAPGLVTGGSTSGPAAAVASGQADIGLGTDTAGSIRVPASVCGLYGLRPTHAAVPLDGVLGLAPSFDTVGWLAADPAVLRAVGAILLPPDPIRRPARLLVADIPTDRTRLLADALAVELAAGAVGVLGDVPGLLAAFRAVQAVEAWRLRGGWIRANPGALSAEVEARFRSGADVDDAAETRARELIAARRARTIDALGEDTWLALPATAGPGHARDAPPAARDAWRQATLARTVSASAYGLPSCVLPDHVLPDHVPCGGGLSGGGLERPRRPPVGWALVGPPGSDLSLLDAVVSAGLPSAIDRRAADRPASR